MAGEHVERSDRRIRIETERGTIEGSLPVVAILRTLDELNMAGKEFLTLHEPSSAASGWPFGSDELAINKRSILFALELSNPPRRNSSLAGTYARGSMRLRVGLYDIQGFLHIPPGGECLKRLNQSSHGFVSLTSASVAGPSAQFATPFLAVNRRHIVAAQEIFHGDHGSAEADVEMSFEVTR